MKGGLKISLDWDRTDAKLSSTGKYHGLRTVDTAWQNLGLRAHEQVDDRLRYRLEEGLREFKADRRLRFYEEAGRI